MYSALWRSSPLSRAVKTTAVRLLRRSNGKQLNKQWLRQMVKSTASHSFLNDRVIHNRFNKETSKRRAASAADDVERRLVTLTDGIEPAACHSFVNFQSTIRRPVHSRTDLCGPAKKPRVQRASNPTRIKHFLSLGCAFVLLPE